MSVDTHCLPTSSLGSYEIAVSNVGASSLTSYIPSGGLGVGNIRGVVVFMHGLSVGLQPIPAVIGADGHTPGFTYYGTSLKNNLVNDGWIVVTPSYPDDFAVGNGVITIWNDLNNDTGHGSRYLNTHLHWWDHLVNYIHTTFSATIPIVAAGGSWGGWHTLQIAANRQSSIVAYCAIVPATLLSYVNYAFTGGVNFGPNTQTNGDKTLLPLLGGTSGLDTSTTHLNGGNDASVNVTIPGIVCYGTNDEAVGWEATTSLPGDTPINSNTDAMLTNAYNAGIPVIRNQTASEHEVNIDEGGTTATYAGTNGTALSSLGSLSVNTTAGLTSSQCAIWVSDNTWRTITFTGTSGGNTLTGCSYSGSNTATVSLGASICNMGSAITGGYTNRAVPYWFYITIDPSYPRSF